MYGLNKLINRACRVYAKSLARLRKHRVILCYHNVGPAGRGYLADSRSIAPEHFAAQMRWLKENVDVVSLDEISRTDNSPARHQVAITFDDGYLNNVETVMPIMRELDLPMTWFVATGYVDQADQLPWWDTIDLLLQQTAGCVELQADEVRGEYDLARASDRGFLGRELRAVMKRVPLQRRDLIATELAQQAGRLQDLPPNAFARPDEIAAIDWNGLDIGGHTVSHPNVAVCSDAERRDELQGGKDRLQQISGHEPGWFAYPFGGPGTYDEASAATVRECGFRGAVTLVPGTVSRHSDPYMLPRIAVSPKLSLPDFKARVGGAPLFARSRVLHEMLARRRGSAANSGKPQAR